ncbi:hypothetical protein NECAME_15749 [Necator americanus]|uniref:Uncharacterized protein n=1 Tax=Necator americanus TaxID=51031 RepID=W2SII0_NECAM|nr:hypothetical protein NECAME_15749 [Necator americanus]ETN68562.1 hypothetical protein NECAME_15749 [Necator americanus]
MTKTNTQQRSKTCPNCRVRTTERQIIKHLFFDSPDEFNSTQLINSDVQLERERSRFREKVPSLEARNRQLEMMLVNQQELEKTLETTKNRLRACEFYKAVTAGKDENAIDKYIGDNGSLEVGQFLNILRRQLKETRNMQVSLTKDLRSEREQLRKSKKKENELKNVVKALERELRDVRSAANMSTSTPFNPKLRSLALDQSPSKRSSLGFNESIELNVDVISSALKRRVPFHERPGPSENVQPLLLDMSDDDEVINTSAADVSLQYPASLDKIASPRVPKTLREGVAAGSGNNRTKLLGGVHSAAEKALENLELRKVSASELGRKPLAKRKIIENSSANQRLSQFFNKKFKSDEVINLED